MICPTCKNDMIVVEYMQIELDYCTNCRGVWFDSDELGLLLECTGLDCAKPLFGNILDTEETKAPEGKRKCPICLRRMKKVTLGQQPVLIDVCRWGDGLWFDGGELSQLLQEVEPSGRPDSQRKVVAFLQEVFKSKE